MPFWASKYRRRIVMYLIDRYLEKVDFKDYDDFSKNLKYKPVEKFNFGYDVVDEYARLVPDKRFSSQGRLP